MIAGNPGFDLLSLALEVWMQHLVDSANNARPVPGRDGLGWGAPMAPELRSLIKTVAFAHTAGMRQAKITGRLPKPLSGETAAKELTERFFDAFPEAAKYTETGRMSYDGRLSQLPRELKDLEPLWDRAEQVAKTFGEAEVAMVAAARASTRETMTPVCRAEVVRRRACPDCGCVLATHLGDLEEHGVGCSRMPL